MVVLDSRRPRRPRTDFWGWGGLGGVGGAGVTIMNDVDVFVHMYRIVVSAVSSFCVWGYLRDITPFKPSFGVQACAG